MLNKYYELYRDWKLDASRHTIQLGRAICTNHFWLGWCGKVSLRDGKGQGRQHDTKWWTCSPCCGSLLRKWPRNSGCPGPSPGPCSAPHVPIDSGAVQYLSSKFHFGLSSLILWLIRNTFWAKAVSESCPGERKDQAFQGGMEHKIWMTRFEPLNLLFILDPCQMVQVPNTYFRSVLPTCKIYHGRKLGRGYTGPLYYFCNFLRLQLF